MRCKGTDTVRELDEERGGRKPMSRRDITRAPHSRAEAPALRARLWRSAAAARTENPQPRHSTSASSTAGAANANSLSHIPATKHLTASSKLKVPPSPV